MARKPTDTKRESAKIEPVTTFVRMPEFDCHKDKPQQVWHWLLLDKVSEGRWMLAQDLTAVRLDRAGMGVRLGDMTQEVVDDAGKLCTVRIVRDFDSAVAAADDRAVAYRVHLRNVRGGDRQ